MADSKTELSEPATTPHEQESEPDQARVDRLLPAIGYAVLSLVSLGICLFVGWYLLDSPAIVAASAPSNRAYYVLLAVLGLATAALLFGAMRSTTKLIGSQYDYALDLVVPAVIAVLVAFGGSWLTRSPAEFTLVVQMRSPDPITDPSEAGRRSAARKSGRSN